MTATKQHPVKSQDFTQLASYKRLSELAKRPFDLTQEGNFNPDRINKYIAEACGFSFLYGTERIDDEVMKELYTLAEEAKALNKMADMQNGAVMNVIEGYPSENRPVLHTALRDFFEQPNTHLVAKEAAVLAKSEVEKLKRFIDQCDTEKKWTDLVVIGIGGSELGPKANLFALKHLSKPDRNVHFIGNIDPDDAARVLAPLNLKKVLVVVISKGGTTLETATNEEIVRERFTSAGLKSKDHFVVVTSKGSPIDDPNCYLECFHLWDWVGGRFSSSSLGGGLPIAFACGFKVYIEFLRGCHAMDQTALIGDLKRNLPLLGALLSIWNRNFLKYQTCAIVPYSQALERYAAHVQQVEMESNGKRIDHFGRAVEFETGPIFWGEPGTNAQHSFFQLIHQGTNPIPIEFIGFKESTRKQDREIKGTTSQEKLLSNLIAQAIALATGQKNENPNKVFPGNRPSHILLAKELTPFTLGALFAYYEHKVAFQGFIWNINSFDQEGVQLGKVLANKMIDCFKAKRAKTKQSYPEGQAYLNQLDRLP